MAQTAYARGGQVAAAPVRMTATAARRTTAARRGTWSSALAAVGLAGTLAACGGGGGGSSSQSATQSTPAAASQSATRAASGTTASSQARSAPAPAAPSFPRYPVVLATAHAAGQHNYVPAISVRGQVGAWIARVPAHGEAGVSITLMRFDQRLLGLALHAGSGTDPGGSGWTYGAAVRAPEIHQLAAAFNGAFHLADGVGGFLADGRVASPLQHGLASVVTYKDGITDIGSWRVELPQPGRAISSVRQNLPMLIDNGQAASNVDSCRVCWGPTLGGVDLSARAGLGIASDGQLVWAAGEGLSVRALADALLSGGAVRALELDINPEWVAGFLYKHGSQGVTPVSLVPNQYPLPGSFLAPYNRDFFTILAR